MTKYKTSIRKLKTKDLDKCVRIYIKTFKQKPYYEKWNYKDAYNYLHKISRLDRKACYVITINNRIIGVLLGYTYDFHGQTTFFLHDFHIDKKYSNKGLGKKFLLNVLRRYGKGMAVSLVVKKNSNAYKLYKKLGMSEYKDYKYLVGYIKTNH